MVAATQTVTAILTILRRYLDKTTLREVLIQLSDVPGNQSYHDTIARLRRLNDTTP